MNRHRLGDLIIPVLATAYTIYMVWEQLSGSYRGSTINYALLTGGAVVLLSAGIIIQSFMAQGAAVPSGDGGGQADSGQAERTIRGVAVLVLTAILVFTFTWVGYALGFFLYSLAVLRLLEVRSLVVTIAVPVSTVLIVHFVFVQLLALPLPAGLLAGIL